MKKVTKADCIKDYIRQYNPTRRELIKYIVIDLSSLCNEEYFDKNYSKYYHGHYSTNFTKWYAYGNVVRKNNRLYLTKQGEKVSLYCYPVEEKYKVALKTIKRLSNRIHEIYEENYRIKKAIKELVE